MTRLLPLLLLAACAVPVHPTTPVRVILDESFLPEERSEIEAAMVSWHRAVPEIDFLVGHLPHAELTLYAVAHLEEGVVYVSRSEGYHDSSCPTPSRETGEDHAGDTWSSWDEWVVCLDAVSTTRLNAWHRLAMHEMGHVLGLGHSPPPSVMAPSIQADADEPTPGDIERVRAVWGFR